MKKVVYTGLNTKCLLITAALVETHPYNEHTAGSAIHWFIKHSAGEYFGMGHQTVINMLENIRPIHVESRPVCLDGNDLYLNSCVISYKMPDRTSRDVLNMFLNRSMRNSRFPANDMVYPKAAVFKCVAGDGTYTSKMIYNEGMDYGEAWQDWFTYLGQTCNKHTYPVLGINTDSVGYNKCVGVQNYYYGSLPQYQIEVAVYDNAAAAINEKDGYWIRTANIIGSNQDYGIANGIQKNRLSAIINGQNLIVSDNVNGLNSIKEKLLETCPVRDNLDMIIINQYSLSSHNNGNLLMTSINSGVNHGVSKYKTLTLLLMNKDKILDVSPNNRNNNLLEGSLHYQKNKKTKMQFRICVGRSVSGMYGLGDGWSFVIPFEKDNSIHTQSMELLKVFFTDGLSEGLRDKYFYTMLLPENNTHKDDVLMDWFKKCSATAKSDEEKLKDAYNNLRDGLVKEYQDIEKYLAANNFNDKKPVPAIKLEAEFEHSPLNKLSFDFAVEVITDINYTRLDQAVQNKYITLKYMVPWIDRRGVKGFVKGNIPLAKFYDKAANVVILNSNKLIAEHMERMVR